MQGHLNPVTPLLLTELNMHVKLEVKGITLLTSGLTYWASVALIALQLLAFNVPNSLIIDRSVAPRQYIEREREREREREKYTAEENSISAIHSVPVCPLGG